MHQDAYQALPTTGKLAENLNMRPGELSERLDPFRSSAVYSYVVDTVQYEEGLLYQTGSGPNFQGGLVTLCSCKHKMRTYFTADSWEGVWIAGYTGSTDLGENRLFYLMRVHQAFGSHQEFWIPTAFQKKPNWPRRHTWIGSEISMSRRGNLGGRIYLCTISLRARATFIANPAIGRKT